ncbi:helix-turn-helix transcriptional regulator [Jiangella alkaliphila]|uniref:Helix-turn-helix domain-containing protein n=1 Tax=Jiangella alkaliphila TaxID=419479 RepID=A0A1H2LCW7_9ACTN|nr:helix-turn-helix transcriptional regulator [Jiangella alkaliphila]SDU78682.1 Helix-turn-helix domain-containing protein [Jiangella alkaliphila]
MTPARELAEFLRTRRARLKPAELGLPVTARRRVDGLRRDEVAQLAGVSVEYYIRLEQGRGGHPSDAILDSVASALRLGSAERDHLFHLARPRRTRSQAAPAQVRPAIAELVAAMPQPVVIVDRRLDVLGRNPLAEAVFGGVHEQTPYAANCAANTFLEPTMRHFFAEWEQVAQDVVALLRRLTGQFPDDVEVTALIDALLAHSADFRRMWAAHDIRQKLHGQKRLRHPLAGEFTLHYEILTLPDDPGISLTVYTVGQDDLAQAALELLAERDGMPAV